MPRFSVKFITTTLAAIIASHTTISLPLALPGSISREWIRRTEPSSLQPYLHAGFTLIVSLAKPRFV
ncbi:hypothetical protein OUZ56_002983 [Daphnia magna]|uniref:Secreted protein n=1 Tax=Daphnia magna TaxID=35525 RepID=A0ABR0A7C6_9CRUS|nr:hypothetical protein OUZ56_002983 [Daphnia magna]